MWTIKKKKNKINIYLKDKRSENIRNKINGRIIKSQAGAYDVYDLESECVYPCKPRGILRKQQIQPKVGDFVNYEKADSAGTQYGVINSVAPRTNDIVRPQVANVDQGIIVISAAEPSFSFYILNKFSALLENQSINPLVLVTKTDLLSKEELITLKDKLNYYENMGYPVIFASDKVSDSYKELTRYLKGKLSVVMGQTGAGKSTALNNLDETLSLETNEISKKLGRGKHTTRTVSVYKIGGGFIADTPGFSSLELNFEDESELAQSFIDFFELSQGCKFRGCLHVNEPKCAVKEALKNGDVLPERYEDYLQFYEEVKEKRENKY